MKRYLSWQFGLDYDAIGKGSGQELFDEQIDVRDQLRSQQGQAGGTEWVCFHGVVLSFLFEDRFVVDVKDWVGRATVTALGAWNKKWTVTDVGNIGRAVADVVLGEEGIRAQNDVVYTGGETITYERLAEVVGEELGTEVRRELLTVPALEEMLRESPEDGTIKYRLVFAKGVGASWEVERTWNWRRGMSVVGVRESMRKNVPPTSERSMKEEVENCRSLWTYQAGLNEIRVPLDSNLHSLSLPAVDGVHCLPSL